MTKPKELKVGDGVLYKNPHPASYGHDAWNGFHGIVLDIDDSTTPYEFIKIKLDNPWSDTFKPISWVERYKLRKLPDRKEGA